MLFKLNETGKIVDGNLWISHQPMKIDTVNAGNDYEVWFEFIMPTYSSVQNLIKKYKNNESIEMFEVAKYSAHISLNLVDSKYSRNQISPHTNKVFLA